MDKVQISFKEREYKLLEKWGISVKPYVSLVDQMAIIEVYMQDLFGVGDEANNYARAENSLIANILELQTNLKLVEDSGEEVKVLVSMDDIFANFDMYVAVENAIINMGDLKRRILKTVEAKREDMRLKNSLGYVLEDLYTKADSLITKLAETEITPESLNILKEVMAEFKESPILQSLSENLKK
jgi:hypothetical protein